MNREVLHHWKVDLGPEKNKLFWMHANSWRMMRDILGDGSWVKLGEFLGYKQYLPKSNKRIRKKRMKILVLRTLLRDLADVGGFEWPSLKTVPKDKRQEVHARMLMREAMGRG